MSLAAMKLALEALEMVTVDAKTTPNAYEASRQAITALRSAIEQAQEPVALEAVYEIIIHWDEGGGKRSRRELARRIAALYTAPRQWQGLTEEEMQNATQAMDAEPLAEGWSELVKFARAIEAKLKEKNNG